MKTQRLKLNKIELDNYTSFIGFIGGVVKILGANGWISTRLSDTIVAICLLAGFYLTNKPATEHPNTQDLERNL
jgi:hypothetical protein